MRRLLAVLLLAALMTLPAIAGEWRIHLDEFGAEAYFDLENGREGAGAAWAPASYTYEFQAPESPEAGEPYVKIGVKPKLGLAEFFDPDDLYLAPGLDVIDVGDVVLWPFAKLWSAISQQPMPDPDEDTWRDVFGGEIGVWYGIKLAGDGPDKAWGVEFNVLTLEF